MHKATKPVKAEVGGDCKFDSDSPVLMKRIQELEKESGHPIYDLFEKYSFQGAGNTMPSMKPFAEADQSLEKEFQEYEDWVNNGQPTGIRSNREFYELQQVYFSNIVYNFD